MKFFGAFSFVSVISIAAQASAGTVVTLPSGEGTRTKEAHLQSLNGTVNKGSALFSRTAEIEDVKGTPYGLGLSSPPGIASLTRTALSPVRPNLGSRSIQTEMLRTILGRLLQLGGTSQDKYNSGKTRATKSKTKTTNNTPTTTTRNPLFDVPPSNEIFMPNLCVGFICG